MSNDDESATFPPRDDLDFVNHARHRMRRPDDSLVDSRVPTSGLTTMEGRERNGYSKTNARQSTSEVPRISSRRFSMQECNFPEQTQMVAFGTNPELTSRSPRRKSVADTRMSDSRQNANQQGGREESNRNSMRRSIVNSSNKTQRSSMIEFKSTEPTKSVPMEVGPDFQSNDRAFVVPSASSQGLSRQTSAPSQQNPHRRVRPPDNDGQANISSTVLRVVHDGHRQVRLTDRTAKQEYNRPHRSTESHGSALPSVRPETVEDRSARPARNFGEMDKPRSHRMDVQAGQKQASTTAWAAQIEGKMRVTSLSNEPP
jgi:hypothetical protein